METHQTRRAKRLYGPTVQYADGKVVKGKPLDVDRILQRFEQLGDRDRNVFLSVFAHDLTVAIRALLIDRPVPDADLDRVWKINEIMHQLTSCVNPGGRWSAHDEAMLISSIVESSFSYDLDRWIEHALAVAAGNAIGTETTINGQPGAV